MINHNNTEYNGPRVGAIKLKPTVYKVTGGNPGGILPEAGYLSSSVTYDDYSDPTAGGTYPELNSNTPNQLGTNIYEPVRIPFIHKFGGPHCFSTGEQDGGSFDTNSFVWRKEEFLRIKLKKGTGLSTAPSPYTCAILTGTIFPYGQTNTGSISPLGNRNAVSLFRHRFNFQRTKPPLALGVNPYGNDTPVDLDNYQGGVFKPYLSSSIINSYGRLARTKEFQLDTDPRDVSDSFSGQHCFYNGVIQQISFHPSVTSLP